MHYIYPTKKVPIKKKTCLSLSYNRLVVEYFFYEYKYYIKSFNRLFTTGLLMAWKRWMI